MWRGSRRVTRQAPKKASVVKKTFNARSKLNHSKVAQRRRKLRILQFALALVFIVSFFGGVSWLSFSNFLAVHDIVVEGNESVRMRAIQASLLAATAEPSAWLFSRQNTLLYPVAELEKMLAFDFPKVEEISIDSQPTEKRVVVSVRERTPYALWCASLTQEEACYHIDEYGYIFEKSSYTATSTVDFLMFTGGVDESRTTALRLFVAAEYFKKTKEFIALLGELELAARMLHFEGDSARVTLAPDDWELRIALDKDLGATVFNLEAVLEKDNLRNALEQVLYIDMRFDERAYYKLRETTDSEA